MQTKTSGGCSESEANEATVMPNGLPWCSVVTTVTPLAKWDIASLNADSSMGIAGRSVAVGRWLLAVGRRGGFGQRRTANGQPFPLTSLASREGHSHASQ